MQKYKTQAEKDTAATVFNSKKQNNKLNNKNKNKQKNFDLLVCFRNIQNKLQNIIFLNFLTELKRIEKCVDTNYYSILDFLTDNNNINTDIQIQQYI